MLPRRLPHDLRLVTVTSCRQYRLRKYFLGINNNLGGHRWAFSERVILVILLLGILLPALRE
jgi:hypothetical protein